MRASRKISLSSRRVPDILDATVAQYLYIPFHAQGSTTSKTAYYTNVDALATALGSEATLKAAGGWGTSGVLTLDGTNWWESFEQAVADFFGFVDGDQILLQFTVIPVVATVTGTYYVIAISPSTVTAGKGGWGVQLNNASYLMKQAVNNAGSASNVLQTTEDVANGVPSKVTILIDLKSGANGTYTIYENAVQLGSAAMLSKTCTPSIAKGSSIGARSDNSSPGNILPTGTQLHDFFIMKTTVDIAEYLPTLAAQYSAAPYEPPAILSMISGLS